MIHIYVDANVCPVVKQIEIIAEFRKKHYNQD